MTRIGAVIESLQSAGVSISLIGANLKIDSPRKLSAEMKEFLRAHKPQIIETLAPKCSNCALEMILVENNTLWFCPIGCQSIKAN